MQEKGESVLDVFEFVKKNIRWYIIIFLLWIGICVSIINIIPKKYDVRGSILVYPSVTLSNQSTYDLSQSIIRTVNSYLNKENIKREILEKLGVNTKLEDFDEYYGYKTVIDNNFIDIYCSSKEKNISMQIVNEAMNIIYNLKITKSIKFDADIIIVDYATVINESTNFIIISIILFVFLLILITLVILLLDKSRKNIKYTYYLKDFVIDYTRILEAKSINDVLFEVRGIDFGKTINLFDKTIKMDFILQDSKNILIIVNLKHTKIKELKEEVIKYKTELLYILII